MRHSTLIILINLLVFSCTFSKKPLTAQDIIDTAISKHCNGHCDTATVSYVFRGKTYESYRDNGLFRYTSFSEGKTRSIKDVLSNSKFQRFVNDSLVALNAIETTKYANALNSVHYFAWLPYGLNAPAVKKERFKDVSLKGKTYYKIGISFTKDGGGQDFEDQFIYWFDTSDFSLDYLAYSYATNGGGMRFRAAFNRRNVNGINFQDYNNYKPLKNISLKHIDQLYTQDKLQLVSKIELKAISVHHKN